MLNSLSEEILRLKKRGINNTDITIRYPRFRMLLT